MKTLLITGSQGRIGSVLVKGLGESYRLITLDVAGEASGSHHVADITDFKATQKAFQAMGRVDYVLHLAGDTRHDAPWESILTNNIIGTRNVYEAAHCSGVKRIIFASSNHVTGGYEGIPPMLHKQPRPSLIRVRDPIRPDGDYASGKAFSEALARQYYEQHGLQSICLRIGTVRLEDDPTIDERMLKTWLSHRDLLQIVTKALLAKVAFGIYYAVSDNAGRFWDISDAQRDLGYRPQDDASEFKAL